MDVLEGVRVQGILRTLQRIAGHVWIACDLDGKEFQFHLKLKMVMVGLSMSKRAWTLSLVDKRRIGKT